MSDEIYSNSNVVVSESLLKVGATTIPIAGITSFRVITIPPSGPIFNPWIGLAVIICLLLGVRSWWGFFVLAVVLAVIAFRVQPKAKPTFALSVTTSAKEQTVVSSPDLKTIRAIEAALQKAIELRA